MDLERMDLSALHEKLFLERIADSEGLARLVNELVVKESDQRQGSIEDSALRCECGNDACDRPLLVKREVYERVRGDPMLFLIRPGHHVPEAEDIVERAEGFEIVRKHEDVRHRVLETDPRSGAV